MNQEGKNLFESINKAQQQSDFQLSIDQMNEQNQKIGSTPQVQQRFLDQKQKIQQHYVFGISKEIKNAKEQFDIHQQQRQQVSGNLGKQNQLCQEAINHDQSQALQKNNEESLGPKSRSNNSLSIFIEDSETIPITFLQSSPKGKKFVSIKIPMYRTTAFMKMQTQIFILDIKKPGIGRDYQIERRYSDFVEFYETLFYNHPGFILVPFPDRGLQSFIKIKLGFGNRQPGQRQEMIQKRMLQLQNFINFVSHHPQLSNSEQFASFITQNHQVYQESKRRLQKYVEQIKTLEKSSQLKGIISLGKSIWSSYIKKQKKPKNTEMAIGKNDIQFSVVLETVKTQKQKLLQNFNHFEQLQKAQANFSEFVDMPTQNDNLLKLCAKHTSGKQYSKNFADFIQVSINDKYKYNIQRFQEIEKILMYRIQIWQSLHEAQLENHLEKKQKLSRRLEMFERNFLSDWQNVFVQIQKSSKAIHESFIKEWKAYKKSMRKIWKVQKVG